MKSFAKHIISEETTGLTIEAYLRQVLQYSGRKIQKLTRQKGVFLNGKSAYLQKKLKTNDNLRILMLEDTAYGVHPQQGVVNILYEDDHLLVVNKPANQLVHPTGQTNSGTLANHLAYELQQRGITSTIRPIHRLDRNTSGCVVFAKDSHSQHLLAQELKAGNLKRIYHALVKGMVNPPKNTINAPIGPHPTLPNRRAISETGEPAITHYRTINAFADHSLLELTLDTGRTHQIRVHLSHIGHPIIGDTMYGIRSSLIARQALHAHTVTFRHLKDKHEVTVTAPLPLDFSNAIKLCTK